MTAPSAAAADAEGRTDAYLDWALATGFRYFATEAGTIGLLIEWNSPADAVAGVALVDRSPRLHLAGVYRGAEGAAPQRICSLSVPVDAVAQFVADLGPLARRIELAAPVTAPGDWPPFGGERGPQSESQVLAAVLDDGCAFANARFMRRGSTRVLWLWNQDPAAKGLPLEATSGPTGRCTYGYGRQWPQQELDRIIAKTPGLQEPIYAAAGLPGLRHAAAHGAHVMDLLSGGADDTQIVCVQFPQAGIDDPSGRWLARNALDGLHYVLECAGPSTRTVVVNLSWGPQTGPHDGSSALERAIDDLVDQQRAVGRELIVTLPAGNSFGSRAHARLDPGRGGVIDWRVPPDGRTPAFLEVWWPDGVEPAQARLRVRPPQGHAVGLDFARPWTHRHGYATLKKAGRAVMALIVVDPTEDCSAGHRGRHGRWTLEFPPGAAVPPGVAIEVYVARADHNMGARRRAKASFLTDRALEGGRFGPPARRYDEVYGSAIERHGSLNGVATGARSSVAAGYRLSDSKPAPYSSAGPTRGERVGPDYACATDLSAAVPGVRATGVRSGTRIRLVGTSTAAPQLGRQLAEQAAGASLPRFEPLPYPADADQRIGDSCLAPDDDLDLRS